MKHIIIILVISITLHKELVASVTITGIALANAPHMREGQTAVFISADSTADVFQFPLFEAGVDLTDTTYYNSLGYNYLGTSKVLNLPFGLMLPTSLNFNLNEDMKNQQIYVLLFEISSTHYMSDNVWIWTDPTWLMPTSNGALISLTPKTSAPDYSVPRVLTPPYGTLTLEQSTNGTITATGTDWLGQPFSTEIDGEVYISLDDLTFLATPDTGYVFEKWIIENDYEISEDSNNPTTIIPDYTNSVRAIFVEAPEPLTPFLDLDTFYESNSGESITVDATPTDGYPATYTYQWSFKAVGSSSYFVIPSNFGGTAANYQISGDSGNNGLWKVAVTNDTGTTTAEFNYRVYADSDSDGLSDGREEFVLGTDPNDNDSDDDTLLDGMETNTGTWVSASDTGSDPLSNDTDEDGLLDGVETNTGEYVDATDTGTDPNNSDTVSYTHLTLPTNREV